MPKLIYLYITLMYLLSPAIIYAQVNIMSGFINPASIYPESLLQLNVYNQEENNEEVYIEAHIASSSGENIIAVKTNTFALTPGVHSVSGFRPGFASVIYGNGTHGKHLSTYHYLAAG